MRSLLFLLFISFLTIGTADSQVLPEEGSMLNYRLVAFSFPGLKNGTNYKLEIALGNYDKENVFKKNIIKTFSCNENRKIAEVPSFGKQYTWRIVSNTDKTIKKNLYHFATILNPEVDTTNVRLRIIKQTEKYRDAHICLDYNRVMYDMDGHPLWFLPGKISSKNNGRDLKLSQFGTITVLVGDIPYEVNYNGDILWKGPNNGIVSGTQTEHYHHEFTRLDNGHYMVMGDESIVLKPQLMANNTNLPVTNNANPQKSLFGTLIEYDKNGNVVWSWKSSNYFKESDLYNYQNGSPLRETVDVHSNSFYFDQANKVIYMSFKNISRIIKIKYPEGTVLNTYGEIFKQNIPEKGNGLFCQQHSIRHSDRGYIYLLNNNTCNQGKVPTVIQMQEPDSGINELIKIWEYECTNEANYPPSSGGNVIELPDNSLFISIGSSIFIVDHEKNIEWSAIAEMRNPVTKQWGLLPQLYRASISLNLHDIEKLIWNSGN